MKKEYSLKYEKYEFLFVLEHQKNNLADLDENIYDDSPYIYCKLYRKDMVNFFWDWQGFLLPNEKIEFHLIYDDQVNIKGYISLFHSLKTGYNYVFMDAFFGIGYEEHFEGNILEVDGTPLPPIPPGPSPTPSPMPVPSGEIIGPAGYKDLFPYLYMQYWPALQPQDQLFLIQVPTDLSSSAFYTTLQTLKQNADARQNMENEALSYINGTGNYAGCFIPTVNDLAYPLNIFPEIYNDIYTEELINADDIIIKIAAKKNEGEDELYITSTYPDQIRRVWENIIALNIIEGYEPFNLDQFTKVLIIDHIVQYLAAPPEQIPADWLQKLIHASLVLPATIFPLPAFSSSSVTNDIYSGVITPYAIGDLQMVQHKLRGYELGDIASIENVLAGEIKKTTQRKKEMVKDSFLQTNTGSTKHKKSDYGDQLEKQVYKTIIDSLVDTYDYNSLTVSYGPPTTGTYGGSVTNTKGRNKLEQSPVEFAKKVLSKTLTRLDEKISERREHIVKNETEELVSHIIDNRKGKVNIKGVYYWLNRIYEMKLVNYGHRFMMEFIITKPVISVTDQIKGPFAFPPVPPGLLPAPILSYEDITEKNYILLGQQYGIYDLPFPPAPNKIVTGKLSGEEYRLCTEMKVPDGYLPKQLSFNSSFPVTTPAITGTLIAGEVQVPVTSSSQAVPVSDPLQLNATPPIQVAAENLVVPVLLEISSNPISFTVPVTTSPPPSPAMPDLTCPTLPTIYMSLSLLCTCSDELMNRWKQQIFLLIQQGYESAVKKFQSTLKLQAGTNPQVINQQIQKIITSSCSQVLWEQHLKINGIQPTILSPSQDTVNKSAYTQFFNESFEWSKMIYSIEGSNTSNVKEELAEELDDSLNTNKLIRFLSSDQVKVMVPVNQAFHYRIMYYLNTGLIAYGQDHLVPVLVPDQTLAVKLKKVFDIQPYFDVIEIERWNMSIPTEMQWLAESIEFPIEK